MGDKHQRPELSCCFFIIELLGKWDLNLKHIISKKIELK